MKFILLALGALILAGGVTTATGVRAQNPVAENPVAAELLYREGIRGVTIGPIENELFKDRGYGTAAYDTSVAQVARLGGNWVSLTPFGRIWDLEPSGVDLRFEAPIAANVAAVTRAIEAAHAQGQKVLLVPHLWCETGGWRGEIDPKTPLGWRRWAQGYERFLLFWARIAAKTQVEMFSVGVELRTWVTTSHAPSFSALIAKVRKVYPGQLTYGANWDDVEETVVLGNLDVIGINAFYPLADKENASEFELIEAASRVKDRVFSLSASWNKPVVFTEIGYTTRNDPALRPWEWPDGMTNVTVNQRAQAEAYRALIAAFIDEPWFLGFFVWRSYADPFDLSQEAEWGFSPLGKVAELVLRDAFNSPFGVEGPRPLGAGLWRSSATRVGLY